MRATCSMRKFFRAGDAPSSAAPAHVELLARSGNVDNPDRNWSPWRQVDLTKDSEMGVPAGALRPVESRAARRKRQAGGRYRHPELSAKECGARDRRRIRADGRALSAAVEINRSQPGYGCERISSSHFESPVPSTRDRDSIGVKWNAHDDNDDQLVYSVYYRGDGETRWLLLKENLTDKAYSFDASLLPDGGYTIKVVASDGPSHSPGEALTATKESRRFEVGHHSSACREPDSGGRRYSDSRPLPRRRWILQH